MATRCNNAPIFNEEFYNTGPFLEPRPTHLHQGVDLATGSASPVYSMNSGTVAKAVYEGTAQGYGAYVVINGSDGNSFLYGDLQDNLQVSEGDSVSQGTLLGYCGNPAGTTSTGLHVHVEYQRSSIFHMFGVMNNPCEYMGIENVQNAGPYIFDGTPIPPEPPEPPEPEAKKKKKHYPWFILNNYR